MNKFSALFGIDQEKIRKNVLLLPFLPPRVLETFGIKALSNGKPFAAASTNTLSIIRTNIGPQFVGDALMYLKNSPAENIFFLGSCGLFNKKLNAHLGTLVAPKTAYALESFSDIVTQRTPTPSPAHPDEKLLEDFLKTTTLNPLSTVCVSFGSLYFENTYFQTFQDLNADIIEMECAAFFHASHKTGKRAAALLYITDILDEKEFHVGTSPADKKSLADTINQACKAIDLFAQKNP